MGVFSGSFFKWVSHPFLCDVTITKWPFKTVCFPRKRATLHLQLHICTCWTKFMHCVCWHWAGGDAGKSLLFTFRTNQTLLPYRLGIKRCRNIGVEVEASSPSQPSPAVSMCAAVNISWWPAWGGQALLLLLHRHLFIICPSEFLPLLEERCSYHHFCLPCGRQALISLSVPHWGLHKSSEVGQKLECCDLQLLSVPSPFLLGIKPVCIRVTADTHVLHQPESVVPKQRARNPPWLC